MADNNGTKTNQGARRRERRETQADALCVDRHGAAEALGIGITLLDHLVRSGELESITIGRTRRIPRASLEKYVAKKLAAANGATA